MKRSGWQTYTDPLAVQRMGKGLCPECGGTVSEHTGWGGRCGLTDNGVAGRIHQFEADAAEEREKIFEQGALLAQRADWEREQIQQDRERTLIASMPGTGDCHTKDCPGSYDAWGKCHRCGSVD